jgi:hypothetical protein
MNKVGTRAAVLMSPGTWLVFVVAAVIVAVVVAGQYDSEKDLLVNLAATFIGVMLGLSLERWVEDRSDEADRRERVRAWITLILKGAEASAIHVKQMLENELKTGIPTYTPDRFIAATLEPVVTKDLLDHPKLVDAHRQVVFELSHLDRKANLLLAILPTSWASQNQQELLERERASTAAIASNAKGLLEALQRECTMLLQRL